MTGARSFEEVLALLDRRARKYAQKHGTCPRCGAPMVTGYGPGLDPGDVEPWGECSSPPCPYSY